MGDKIIVHRDDGCLMIVLIISVILYFTTSTFDGCVDRTDKQSIIHSGKTLIIKDGENVYTIDLSGSKPCLK